MLGQVQVGMKRGFIQKESGTIDVAASLAFFSFIMVYNVLLILDWLLA